jgi:hypothetical protein
MSTPPPSFPENNSFWELSRSAEQACEVASQSSPEVGQSEITTRLGTVVSLLYRMACCHWGCHAHEHVFEYLAGRTCTSAQSAYRLIGFGYYDEALALSRNVAEIGNLAHLFFTDNSHIRLWLDLPDKDRRRNYSPAMVRSKLTSLGAVVPTDQDRYSWLCEIGTHVTPRTLPQAHNDEKRPLLGAVFQPEGWEISMEALAWSVCTVSAPLAKLALLDREHAERLFEESISLASML